MIYYIDTYYPAKVWHKDALTVLKWLKDKAHEKVKSRITNERDVIVAVLNMLAKEEYGDGETYRVPNIFYADLQFKSALFMSRPQACSVLNQLMEMNDCTIEDAFAEKDSVKPLDEFDHHFWELVK